MGFFFFHFLIWLVVTVVDDYLTIEIVSSWSLVLLSLPLPIKYWTFFSFVPHQFKLCLSFMASLWMLFKGTIVLCSVSTLKRRGEMFLFSIWLQADYLRLAYGLKTGDLFKLFWRENMLAGLCTWQQMPFNLWITEVNSCWLVYFGLFGF